MSQEDSVEIPMLPVISSVKTRSQSSRKSDKLLENIIPQTTIQKKAKKKGKSKEGSLVNMELFGDVDLGAGGSSNSDEGDDVSSVSSSHVNVTLEDIEKRKEERANSEKRSEKAHRSIKGSTVGSLTKSEMIRINLEIKRMELADKRAERELELQLKR